MGLDPRIAAAVSALGFTEPTPIQAAAVPALLAGRDVVGRARTGSGKTAAFALPVLQRVREGGRGVRALVLAPTRELALQVTEAIAALAGRLRVPVVPIYGGAPYAPQLRALRAGATVVVGTPGRILDHVDRGTLDLSALEVLVLDEADEMLRMGFLDEVERVLAVTPPTRQVALFSATMPDPIRRIAATYLKDPEEIQVERSALSTHHVEQQWMLVPGRRKVEGLVRVLQGIEHGSTLVFARTRAACADVAAALSDHGFDADALHGDMSQTAREQVLGRFRAGRVQILVATDVAARGLDVDGITHVLNLDLPPDTASYVHRIGRTGRAGRDGVAISFIMPAERHRLRTLERSLRVEIREARVPSDGDIARIRQERLRRALVVAHEEAPPDARAWLAAACGETGLSVEDLGAAALALLARDRRVDLMDLASMIESPRTRSVGSPPPREEHDEPAPRARDGEVRLFLGVGRRHGVRTSDVVGALANDRGVVGRSVGKITVLERKSFFGVPREVADRLLAEDQPLSIRGNDVRIVLARV
jgi:ATP-dependent RNA helicase DeaD